MKSSIAGFMGLWLLAGASISTQGQMMKLTDVMLIHAVDVTEANAAAFEAAVDIQLASPLRKRAPAWTLHLVRKDRGNRPGRYQVVLMPNVGSAPRAGLGATPEASPLALLLKATPSALTPVVAMAVNPSPIEYRRVGLDTPGADKLNPLPEVDVLGIHYIKVRPDRRDAFDRFVVDKLHPAVGNLRPDLRLIYYKPVRGDDPGNYITIFALTVASRDKYWPKGQDSDVLKEAFKPMPPLAKELETYLVEGSYATGNLAAAVFESREWADWVAVPAAGR